MSPDSISSYDDGENKNNDIFDGFQVKLLNEIEQLSKGLNIACRYGYNDIKMQIYIHVHIFDIVFL